MVILQAHDTDSFNRWDAGNRLATKIILNLATMKADEIEKQPLPKHFVDAIRTVLTSCTVRSTAVS